MSPLVAIAVASAVMTLIAMSGALSLLMQRETLERWIPQLLALASGTLFGGALFHLLPESLEHGRDSAAGPWPWVAGGFVLFLVIELGLRAHRHGHGGDSKAPFTWLVLLGDGLHNLLDGLAVGAAFVADVRIGWAALLAAALHEVPQELGDFGALVAGGMSRRQALKWNVVSALSFPLGAVSAWALGRGVDVWFLVAMGAGNFLYLSTVDFLPEVFRRVETRARGWVVVTFVAGAALLFVLHRFAH